MSSTGGTRPIVRAELCRNPPYEATVHKSKALINNNHHLGFDYQPQQSHHELVITHGTATEMRNCLHSKEEWDKLSLSLSVCLSAYLPFLSAVYFLFIFLSYHIMSIPTSDSFD